ncbi:FkbM family methyltransferase [Candidatus Woesearchaeota archaeon]|nr:FkbM family methyltransferase [Candidatus Woesearchaeota archaeon]
MNIKKEKLNGNIIRFQTYHQFYGSFCDVFLEKQNFFLADNNKPIIFDIGGNLGMTTLYFKKLYPNSKITIIEPDPLNIEDIKHNIKNLKDVNILEIAVSKRKGTTYFFRDKNPRLTGGSLVKNQTNKEKITVKTQKLSKLIPRNIDYLKLDIEGSESEVIEEMNKNLGKSFSIKNIFIEFHYNQLVKNNKLSNIISFLEKRNFEYIIESRMKSPYKKEKAFGLNIFAYKK